MTHILLIEDDNQVREMLKLTLQEAGHTVQTAQDGKRGIALFHDSKPDILITDLVMPGQEGIETIDQIRQTDSQTRIIAISGGGTVPPRVYLDIARQLGADRIFAKPIDSKLLLQAIDELLATQPPA